MITCPSTSQLVQVVRRELAENVAPAVSGNTPVATSLQMIDQILRTLVVRSDSEIAWMHEESKSIESLAAEFVAQGDAGPVATALDALRSKRTGGLSLAEAAEDYQLASELLSLMIEHTQNDATGWTERVMGLLERRLEHEVAIMGDFSLIARG